MGHLRPQITRHGQRDATHRSLPKAIEVLKRPLYETFPRVEVGGVGSPASLQRSGPLAQRRETPGRVSPMEGFEGRSVQILVQQWWENAKRRPRPPLAQPGRLPPPHSPHPFPKAFNQGWGSRRGCLHSCGGLWGSRCRRSHRVREKGRFQQRWVSQASSLQGRPTSRAARGPLPGRCTHDPRIPPAPGAARPRSLPLPRDKPRKWADGDSSHFILVFQNCLSYSNSFVFPYKF